MSFLQIYTAKMARTAHKPSPGPSPRAVRTPGSYGDSSGGGTPAKGPLNKARKRGRPIAKKTRKPRRQVRERANYTEQDMLEALRLCQVEGFAKKTAAKHLNEVKLREVPVQTLRDRLERADPLATPQLGRPQEWN